MRLYTLMSAAPRLSSYLGKVPTVNFIAVLMPMIAAVLYVLLAAGISIEDSVNILIALLLATLGGTAATLAALYWLLEPVTAAARVLRGYLGDRTIRSLPTRYEDRAGVLMANVQEVIIRLDIALDTAESLRAPHDVPPEMQTAAIRQTGADSAIDGGLPSSNPTALRLSLIGSLATLTNARHRVGTAGRSGRQLVMLIPLLPPEMAKQAA